MYDQCAIPNVIEGKEFEFKVIKLDQKRNNIVLSRRSVMESKAVQNAKRCLSNLTRRPNSQRCGQKPHRLRCIR